jgi:thiosulfate/3-mercaptopyruvate sulfurtransferase
MIRVDAKKIILWGAAAVLFGGLASAAALAQRLPPILSTEDLASNQKLTGLIILDIRKAEEYKAGHIPGAISVFHDKWSPGRSGLQNEMPPDRYLMDLLSSSGIQPGSRVVVYGKTDTGANRVNATNIAWVLKYAGVGEVSVLSGGFEKWSVLEKRAVSTDVVKPQKMAYTGTFIRRSLVKKADVQANIGKAIVVDVREPAFFSGQQKLPFVPKAGRIKGAVNLPTVQVFEKYPPGEHLGSNCWTYKGNAALKKMATGVVGNDLSKEIIVYCDSGRVASAWWFILSEVLGYQNVRNYDGSMEEWTKDPAAPVEP